MSWLKLPSLNDVNYLAKYGFIHDDRENRKISLHCIFLVHGLEVKRPQNVIDSLISITENILSDIPEDYPLFLQDMFPYLEKYLLTDYLSKLVDRIEYIMKLDVFINNNLKRIQHLYMLCSKHLTIMFH